MRRELSQLSSRRSKQTLRSLVEVTVKHPYCIVPSGNIFLEKQLGLVDSRIRVVDLQEVFFIGQYRDAPTDSIFLEKLAGLTLYDHRELIGVREIQHIFAGLRQHGVRGGNA